MTAPALLWAMRPEAAALEEEAGAVVVPVKVEPAAVVWVLTGGLVLAGGVVFAGGAVLATGAEEEALPRVATEVLARVNGMELIMVAVPVGVTPAIQQKKNEYS